MKATILLFPLFLIKFLIGMEAQPSQTLLRPTSVMPSVIAAISAPDFSTCPSTSITKHDSIMAITAQSSLSSTQSASLFSSATSSSSSLSTSDNITPILPSSPSALSGSVSPSDPELVILATQIKYETETLEESLSRLRRLLLAQGYPQFANDLKNYTVRRLAQLVQESAKSAKLADQIITTGLFDRLVKLYNQTFYTVKVEFRGLTEAVQRYLIKRILQQSKYTDPQVIKYDIFTLEQAFAALEIYKIMYAQDTLQSEHFILFNSDHPLYQNGLLYMTEIHKKRTRNAQ